MDRYSAYKAMVQVKDGRIVLALTLFVDRPEIPMDNNQGERTHRKPVCGRKQFYGSYAFWAGQLAVMLFSLFATLQLGQLNPRT